MTPCHVLGVCLANSHTRALSNHNLIVFLFFSILQVWLLSSYQLQASLPNTALNCWRLSSHRCQVRKFSSNGSCHEGGNPTVQTLCHVNQSWPESSIISQCADLPGLIPNLSKKSYPAATVLPYAKNLPLCTVTSDEDICIWLQCSNGITTSIQLTLFEFKVRNLNFPPKKRDCENFVKTLCRHIWWRHLNLALSLLK